MVENTSNMNLLTTFSERVITKHEGFTAACGYITGEI